MCTSVHLCYGAVMTERRAEDGGVLDAALRALADPNRRAILRIVRGGPRSVNDVADEVGLSQQATSHHLRVLHRAGLAQGTREGTRHLYAVDTDGLAAVRDYLEDFWPTHLQALKRAIEHPASTERAAPSAERPADEHGVPEGKQGSGTDG